MTGVTEDPARNHFVVAFAVWPRNTLHSAHFAKWSLRSHVAIRTQLNSKIDGNVCGNCVKLNRKEGRGGNIPNIISTNCSHKKHILGNNGCPAQLQSGSFPGIH